MNPGLAPIVGDAPRVLLLGSFPSEKTLRTGEYYANRRNQFWELCSAVFGVAAELPYPQRVQQLQQCGVALWDVLQAGERDPNDFALNRSTIIPNELAAFLDEHPTIRTIGLNGRTAAELFEQYFAGLRVRPLRIIALPSSRGAHEPTPLPQKIAAWSALRD